ncbi:hypothetical protein [Olivibacter jilunii]|uniref:hypothetical protein n=1 Tax=Olivibacter jilunii TaxID=985016 RepID=UPI0010327AF7|nr:hypothetical protein [Olivibacter jilunii]
MEISINKLYFPTGPDEEVPPFTGELSINGKDAGHFENMGARNATMIFPIDEGGKIRIAGAAHLLALHHDMNEDSKKTLAVPSPMQAFTSQIEALTLFQYHLMGGGSQTNEYADLMDKLEEKALIHGIPGKECSVFLLDRSVEQLMGTPKDVAWFTDFLRFYFHRKLPPLHEVFNSNIPESILTNAGLKPLPQDPFTDYPKWCRNRNKKKGQNL